MNQYDFVVLPGSKNTVADLAWLRQTGLANWIVEQHRGGATVVGICGGYQMLGRMIHDPDAMESRSGSVEGLGLLPATTSLSREKRTEAVKATTPGGMAFDGYEIHLGVTTLDRNADFAHFARLDDGSVEGVRGAGVIGTYLHGAFEHPGVCAEVFGIEAPSAISKALTMRASQHGSNSTSGTTSGSQLSRKAHMHWEFLLRHHSFDLRRSGRFLVADLNGPITR